MVHPSARLAAVVLLVVSVVECTFDMSRFTHTKRKQDSESSSSNVFARLEQQVSYLTDRLRSLTSPSMPEGGFLLSRGAPEYQRAIDWCWAGDFSVSRSEVLRANRSRRSAKTEIF